MGDTKKTAIIRNLNKCVVLDDHLNELTPTLYGGGKEAIVAYVKKENGELVKVYNRSEYTFEVSSLHLYLEAYSQRVDPVINSHKYDMNPRTRLFDEGFEVVSYEGAFDISANSSTESRDGEFVVLQPKSGLSFTCKYTQWGVEDLGYSFDRIKSVSVGYEDIDSNGGTATPSISVTVILNKHYSDETTESVEKTYGDAYVSVTKASGKAIDGSGATISSTGVVSVGERTDTGDKNKGIFNVERLEGTVEIPLLSSEKTRDWTWNTGYEVEQQPTTADKKVYTGEVDYDLWSDAPESISAEDRTIAVSYRAYKTLYYYWESNPEEILSEKATETLNISFNGVSSVSGEGTLSLSVSENIAGARDFSVRVYHANTELYDETHVVTQEAVMYDFYLSSESEQECSATESTVYVSVVSSRNGKVWQPSFSTNSADAKVGTPTLSGTTYTVPVTIAENTSIDARSIVVTATQTRWDEDASVSATIVQAGAALNLPKAALIVDEVTYTSSAKTAMSFSFYFDARDTKAYMGGTLRGVRAMLITKDVNQEVQGFKDFGDIAVAKGSSSSSYSGTLSTGGKNCKFVIYYDSGYQFESDIEEV